jgi:hypothetical protein
MYFCCREQIEECAISYKVKTKLDEIIFLSRIE